MMMLLSSLAVLLAATGHGESAQTAGEVIDTVPDSPATGLLFWIVWIAGLALLVGMALCLYRVIKGPHLADRVLVSHDRGWYRVGEPGGGKFRPYDVLFQELIPRMRKDHDGAALVRQITRTNPQQAFGIRLRIL